MPKLSALLDDVFHPESYLPAHVETQRCYDFTLGVPLLSVPIISTAISLLRFAWQKQTMLQTEISQLIHSIYYITYRMYISANIETIPIETYNHCKV